MSAEFDIIPEYAQEALRIWDSGQPVFSVEMGGLGPGYEMAIQGLVFELIRALAGFDWAEKDLQTRFEILTKPVVSACNELPWGGFSGAQVGGAQNFAAQVCRRGYRAALRDPMVKDRLIQVSKKDLRTAR